MTIWQKESCSSVCCISSRWGIIRILVTSHVKGFTYKTIHESVLEKIIYNYMCRNNFILPCKSIYNFNFDLKVMRDQPRTEQLIKRFFWCQWDVVHQRLYYLHYVKRGEGERARIAPSVSCVQFYQNSQHDNIVSTAWQYCKYSTTASLVQHDIIFSCKAWQHCVYSKTA